MKLVQEVKESPLDLHPRKPETTSGIKDVEKGIHHAAMILVKHPKENTTHRVGDGEVGTIEVPQMV